MAYDIDFNPSAVKGTISNMDGVYTQISALLKEINGKKDTIAGFWSCIEANSFLNVLASLSTDFSNFEKKYDAFKTALNQVIETYEKDNEAFVSKINAIAKVNGNASSGNSGASGSN